MTEQEWKVSTDPAAMYAFVKDRVTERQQRFFVEACRKLCVEWQYVGGDHYKAAFVAWCTGLLHRSPTLAVRADLLREIIGNPLLPIMKYISGVFYQEESRQNAIEFDPAWLTWNNATVPNLVREMMEEKCEACKGSGFSDSLESDSCCFKCDAQGYIPRAEPRWEMMPIIADALEEAGCTEAAILDHLRGTELCSRCKSGWATSRVWHGPSISDDEYSTSSGRCRHCNGTGKCPVRHVAGCWVLELFIDGVTG